MKETRSREISVPEEVGSNQSGRKNQEIDVLKNPARLVLAGTGNSGMYLDYVRGPNSEGETPCSACGHLMDPIFRITLGTRELSFDRCPSCRPMTAAEAGYHLDWTSVGRVRTQGKGMIGLDRVPLSPADEESFSSRVGGSPLLMDEEGTLPWRSGEDFRPRLHLLSLVDYPEIDFDPTGFPIAVFMDEEGELTWVADGR